MLFNLKYPLVKLSKNQIDNIKILNHDSRIKFEYVSCLNCAADNHMRLFTSDRYGLNVNLVLCNNCGLMFMNPLITKNSADFLYSSDLYRNILHEEFVEKKTWGGGANDFKQLSTTEHAVSFNLINSLNIKYSSICDVGCGNSNNVSLFQSIGKDACGYEPSKYFSDLGQRNGLNIVNGFVDDIKGEYDLVLMIHVLEHLINPIEVIKKLRNNIKKYLFIEVPVSVDKLQSFQYSHTYYFSINTLTQIITKCGFKRIYIKHTSRRVNDYIYVLFEKTDDNRIHEYNYTQEVKKYKKIYYKLYIKNLIKRIIRLILKKINPNIEKKIVKIIDLRTLGD